MSMVCGCTGLLGSQAWPLGLILRSDIYLITRRLQVVSAKKRRREEALAS